MNFGMALCIALLLFLLVDWLFKATPPEFVTRGTSPESGTRGKKKDPRAMMRMAVSIAMLAATLFVILSGQYPDGTQKWAFGALGGVVAFWMKS